MSDALAANVESELRARSAGHCELCKSGANLEVYQVPPAVDAAAERSVLVCGECAVQIRAGVGGDSKHWTCLREAIWSEVPAVQVLSWRLLTELEDQDWASDLLAQVYLDEQTLEWARAGGEPYNDDDTTPTLDSNGTVLVDGDSVTLIKDLDVKGAGFVAKRGTVVKDIRLTNSPENIEGRVNKTTIVLKTKFLKKVG